MNAQQYYYKAKRIKAALEHLEHDNTLGGRAAKKIIEEELGGKLDKANVAVEGFFNFLFGNNAEKKKKEAEEKKAKEAEEHQKLLDKIKDLPKDAVLNGQVDLKEEFNEYYGSGFNSTSPIVVTPSFLKTEIAKLSKAIPKCIKVNDGVLSKTKVFASLLRKYEKHGDDKTTKELLEFIDCGTIFDITKSCELSSSPIEYDKYDDCGEYYVDSKGFALSTGNWSSLQIVILEPKHQTEKTKQFGYSYIAYTDTHDGYNKENQAKSAIAKDFSKADCEAIGILLEDLSSRIIKAQNTEYDRFKSNNDFKYIKELSDSSKSITSIESITSIACRAFIELNVEVPSNLDYDLQELEHAMYEHYDLLEFLEKRIAKDN